MISPTILWTIFILFAFSPTECTKHQPGSGIRHPLPKGRELSNLPNTEYRSDILPLVQNGKRAWKKNKLRAWGKRTLDDSYSRYGPVVGAVDEKRRNANSIAAWAKSVNSKHNLDGSSRSAIENHPVNVYIRDQTVEHDSFVNRNDKINQAKSLQENNFAIRKSNSREPSKKDSSDSTSQPSISKRILVKRDLYSNELEENQNLEKRAWRHGHKLKAWGKRSGGVAKNAQNKGSFKRKWLNIKRLKAWGKRAGEVKDSKGDEMTKRAWNKGGKIKAWGKRDFIDDVLKDSTDFLESNLSSAKVKPLVYDIDENLGESGESRDLDSLNFENASDEELNDTEKDTRKQADIIREEGIKSPLTKANLNLYTRDNRAWNKGGKMKAWGKRDQNRLSNDYFPNDDVDNLYRAIIIWNNKMKARDKRLEETDNENNVMNIDNSIISKSLIEDDIKDEFMAEKLPRNARAWNSHKKLRAWGKRIVDLPGQVNNDFLNGNFLDDIDEVDSWALAGNNKSQNEIKNNIFSAFDFNIPSEERAWSQNDKIKSRDKREISKNLEIVDNLSKGNEYNIDSSINGYKSRVKGDWNPNKWDKDVETRFYKNVDKRIINQEKINKQENIALIGSLANSLDNPYIKQNDLKKPKYENQNNQVRIKKAWNKNSNLRAWGKRREINNDESPEITRYLRAWNKNSNFKAWGKRGPVDERINETDPSEQAPFDINYKAWDSNRFKNVKDDNNLYDEANANPLMDPFILDDNEKDSFEREQKAWNRNSNLKAWGKSNMENVVDIRQGKFEFIIPFDREHKAWNENNIKELGKGIKESNYTPDFIKDSNTFPERINKAWNKNRNTKAWGK